MALNFPSFGGPRIDRRHYQAKLAERAILGGATAKRPIRRPVSLKHPIRQIDGAPIRCIQNTGYGVRRVNHPPSGPLLDRIARRLMIWTLRGVAAAVAFVMMSIAPGWIESALASSGASWGF